MEMVQCDKAMFCEVVRIEEDSRNGVGKDIFIVGNYKKESEFPNVYSLRAIYFCLRFSRLSCMNKYADKILHTLPASENLTVNFSA
jgi:hypothetical protein